MIYSIIIIRGMGMGTGNMDTDTGTGMDMGTLVDIMGIITATVTDMGTCFSLNIIHLIEHQKSFCFGFENSLFSSNW